MFKRKSKSDKPSKSAAKAKKAKKAKPEKPKAAKRSGPTVALKKQATDIYTIMLIIAFAAVSIACILLWREMAAYGQFPWWKT